MIVSGATLTAAHILLYGYTFGGTTTTGLMERDLIKRKRKEVIL
jgi:hypothetical protein